jgi:dTDP-4-amino-4,6-dideoxygalactose transaminase
MKVPFFDLKKQLPLIRPEIEERFSSIIDNTAFVSGSTVGEFQKLFSKLHTVKYTLGISSGTAGNHISVLACNIGFRDEVIVPVNTFIATAEGVSQCGATPIYVDIDEKTYNIDARKIEEAITKRTKAIYPVHLYGQSANMDPILSIAKKYKLQVIEDASQAHLAEYRGKMVGGLSNISSWSFYPGKNLGAWGEAGGITTNDEKLFNYSEKYINHGSSKKYFHDLIGHNYRMSEFQAAVLIEKMKYLNHWTDLRRANAKKYNERLTGTENICIPHESPDCKHVYHLYVIRAKNRTKLISYLNDKGIGTGVHYPFPLHLTDAYKYLDYKKGDFPISERCADEIVSLPMYPELKENEINYVCDSIRSFYK